jgi:hypothetical protein
MQVWPSSTMSRITSGPNPGRADLPRADAAEITSVVVGQEDVCASVPALQAPLELARRERERGEICVVGHGDEQVDVLRAGAAGEQRTDERDPPDTGQPGRRFDEADSRIKKVCPSVARRRHFPHRWDPAMSGEPCYPPNYYSTATPSSVTGCRVSTGGCEHLQVDGTAASARRCFLVAPEHPLLDTAPSTMRRLPIAFGDDNLHGLEALPPDGRIGTPPPAHRGASRIGERSRTSQVAVGSRIACRSPAASRSAAPPQSRARRCSC